MCLSGVTFALSFSSKSYFGIVLSAEVHFSFKVQCTQMKNGTIV